MLAQAHARLKRSQLLHRVISQEASQACGIEQIADYSLAAGRCWPAGEARRITIRRAASRRRALWRVKADLSLPVLEILPDGFGPDGEGDQLSGVAVRAPLGLCPRRRCRASPRLRVRARSAM